jgi:hypothetical protein
MNKYFNRFDLLIIGISIAITAIVSTVFGFAGSTIIGTFWSWFWLTLVTQLVIFFSINSYLAQRERVVDRYIEVESLKQLAKFTIRLSCAYCQQPNDSVIQLNQKNTFKCESCNQVNGIFMQFTATTLTTALELPNSALLNSKLNQQSK